MAPCEERVCVLWVASLYHTDGYPVAESTQKYLLTTNNFVSAYRDCFAFCGRQTPRTATQSVRILLFRFRFHSSITILCMCSCISTILSAGDSMRLLWHACLHIVHVFFFFFLLIPIFFFFYCHRIAIPVCCSAKFIEATFFLVSLPRTRTQSHSLCISEYCEVLDAKKLIGHSSITHMWGSSNWSGDSPVGYERERESAADHTLYKWCVCVLEMAMFVLFLLTVSWLCGHRSTSTHRVDQLAHRRVLWLQFLWHPK